MFPKLFCKALRTETSQYAQHWGYHPECSRYWGVGGGGIEQKRKKREEKLIDTVVIAGWRKVEGGREGYRWEKW